MTIEGIDEEINVHTLLQEDRFFYNFPLYLEKPTQIMLENSNPVFDKTRFIGVAGREAFHVFDL